MSNKINEYKLWYVHYDTFFLNINPKLNKQFFDEYQYYKLVISYPKLNGQSTLAQTLLKHFNYSKSSSKNLLIGLFHTVNLKN
jgi:hypothetical protein